MLLAALAFTGTGRAASLTAAPVTVPEWKAVYGEVEARDTVPARARIGGTLETLTVAEGDSVSEGDVIGTIHDDKLDFQVKAYEAELKGLQSSLENARSELERGESLNQRGVMSNQQLDTLKTQVDVVVNNIAATTANMEVVRQQMREGDILAPASGRVLSVPVVEGSVILPGETVATVGSGGFYLRLAIPARHAAYLNEGDEIDISRPEANGETSATGRIAKLYPELENNRLIADVAVEGLTPRYVGERYLVRVPIGERQALMLPADAVTTRNGLDFITVTLAGGENREKTVVTGARETLGGTTMIEVLTGLQPGETVVVP
ncbi:membrane protein [Martelella endophytica]|uniref:Membrane protein n=2 Tax=Martelella endophytica TaxID=1486262 RepID=A0A0D5LVG1_MAREN|nr:membrane protein [Martelella endophytica]